MSRQVRKKQCKSFMELLHDSNIVDQTNRDSFLLPTWTGQEKGVGHLNGRKANKDPGGKVVRMAWIIDFRVGIVWEQNN